MWCIYNYYDYNYDSDYDGDCDYEFDYIIMIMTMIIIIIDYDYDILQSKTILLGRCSFQESYYRHSVIYITAPSVRI